MAFFEKLTETVSNTGREVGSKAKELTEIAKIKNAIATEKHKIEEAYERIGKAYVEQYAKQQDEPDPLFAEDLEVIRQAQQNIEEKNRALDDIKQVRKCPACGTATAADSVFCPKCGERLD